MTTDSISNEEPTTTITDEDKAKEMDVDIQVMETRKYHEPVMHDIQLKRKENEDEDSEVLEVEEDNNNDDGNEDEGKAQFVSVYSGQPSDTSKKSKVFFAVRKGRSTSSCIFLLENDFKEQIHTYTTAEYAKFGTMSEAVQYIESDPLFVVKSSRVTEKGDSNITEEATYTDGQSPKESWESMFIQLMYYHRTHSNTLVPSDCQPLYTWSIDQLKQYDQLKKGLSHTLTEGRVQLLLGLNFDFDREIPEEDHMILTNDDDNDGAELIDNEETDEPTIPRSESDTTSHIGATATTANSAVTSPLVHQSPHLFSSSSSYPPNFTANMQWPMNNVTTNSAIASSMTNNSVAVYQSPHLFPSPFFSNFIAPTQWPINNIPTNRQMFQSPHTPSNRSNVWDDNFAELVKFKVKHGHLNVDDASSLGKWCERQIDHYKVYKKSGTGPLTEDRVRRLKNLGLDLMTKVEKKFHSAIEELKKYKEEHNNFHLPVKSKLYKFLRDQKSIVSIVKNSSSFYIFVYV
jgi:hypothetical protein